jgi:hypothetical protein
MLKILHLLTTVGIIILCILTFNNDNKIDTVGEVNTFTLANIKYSLELAHVIVTDNERVLLTIDSPGGSGSTMRKIVEEISNSQIPIDTYVPDNAASAGAIMFILGDKRYVNKTSIITFHSAHYGSYALTENTLKIVIDLLDQGILEDLVFKLQSKTLTASDVDIKVYKALEIVSAIIQQCGLVGLNQTIRSMYETLVIANELQLNTVYSSLVKTNPSITKAEVKEKIFGNFNVDMIFTGQQLIDMGIAQEFKGEK